MSANVEPLMRWNFPFPQVLVDINDKMENAYQSCLGPIDMCGDKLRPFTKYIGIIAGLAAVAFSLYYSPILTGVGLASGLLIGTKLLPKLAHVANLVLHIFDSVFGQSNMLALGTAALCLAVAAPSVAIGMANVGVGIAGGMLAGGYVPINNPRAPVAQS